MSISAATKPGELPTLDVSDTEPVPFGRLVAVELRKMRDTRAGFWLLLITGVLVMAGALGFLLITLLNDLPGRADVVVMVMNFPLSLLLPVLAITCVTSEWSQRTGLVTFSLEPDRRKVLLAKLVTVLLLVVTTIVFAVVAGAATLFLYDLLSSTPANWGLDGSEFVWAVCLQFLHFLMAFGFAVVILSTPAAIAIYYVVALLLPLVVYGPIMGLVSWGPDVIPWIDLSNAAAPLVGDPTAVEVTGTTYAQVVVTTLIWVVAPLVGGFARVARAEIK